MPCFDAGPSYRELEAQRQRREELQRCEAMLCALVSVLQHDRELEPWLEAVDWKEAGVTREWFDKWWLEHRIADAIRHPSVS